MMMTAGLRAARGLLRGRALGASLAWRNPLGLSDSGREGIARGLCSALLSDGLASSGGSSNEARTSRGGEGAWEWDVRARSRAPLLRDAYRGSGLATSAWGLTQARQYAKGRPRAPINRPVGAGQQIKIVFVSPGILVEPWKKEAKLTWSSLLTYDGWKQRYQRYFVNTGKSLYTLSKLMQSVPNFKLSALKLELAELYETINAAAAKGNRKVVQDSVTDKTWTLFKKEIMERRRGGWESAEWKLADPIGNMKVELLQGRIVQVAPEVQFAQLTCKITSRQTLVAYDDKGVVVAGSADDPVEVTEYWVFERGLGKKMATGAGIRWRLAARL